MRVSRSIGSIQGGRSTKALQRVQSVGSRVPELVTTAREAASTSRSLYDISVSDASATASATSIPPAAWAVAGVAGLGIAAYGLTKSFDVGSRPYTGNVGSEYDAWTEEGILEYYVSAVVYMVTKYCDK